MAPKNRPSALVLNLGVNGLAVVRGLGRQGVDVHGIRIDSGGPGRFSRYCRVADARHLAEDPDALAEWLAAYARPLDRPVVIPTSDRLVLWLAEHRDLLDPVCRLPDHPSATVHAIISKEALYARAREVRISVPPHLVEPSVDELRAWCETVPAPYLLKPYYAEAEHNPLHVKNRMIEHADELIAFAQKHDTAHLIVQQMVRGGDGWQFAVMGLRTRAGRVCGLLSKRKLVQYLPDTGITAYGVIPAAAPDEERVLFDIARSFVDAFDYHGVFVLEWAKDRETGEYFLLDANPRTPYTLAHALACGVNLADLAYRDLCGHDLHDVDEVAPVRSCTWADFWLCLGSWARLRGTGRFGLGALLRCLLRSRAHAVWSWSDPLPGFAHSFTKIAGILHRT